MKLWERYHTPESVNEAIGLLGLYDGAARIIAGGTDLLVDLRALMTAAPAASHPPHAALIDITRIPEMTRIEADGDDIVIGAGVTHTEIVRSALLRRDATCLVESCGVVGGPQVRNVATLGGNVAHALPAGDGTTSLVALAAAAEIFQNGARRWVDIREMFIGTGKSLLDSTRDLLIRFRFHKADVNAGEGTAFSRIMRPQGVALPILGCSVWVRLDDARQHLADVRICIAPVAPVPMRAQAVEQVLVGQTVDDASIDHAIQTARATIKPRTSKYRATADYRDEMIGVLLKRTLMTANERAKNLIHSRENAKA
jgi:carbon-monoxide dehydrogenase medium subunit